MANVTFDYGEPLYFILIAGIAPFTCVIFILLMNRTDRVKNIAVSLMTIFNLLIHLFKLFIFPHYSATADSAYMCTAYTTCALIIITSPFIFMGKNGALKDFLFVVGGIAGLFAIIFPYSIISASAAGTLSPWEIVRYYLNHYLIVATAVLPVMLKIHRLNYRNFFKLPLIFFLYHVIVFANDAVLICAGYMGGYGAATLYDGLCFWNPSRSVVLTDTSPAVLGLMEKLINALTPKIFLTNMRGDEFLWPILYYTPALSLGIMLLEAIAYLICDFSRVKADCLNLKGVLRKIIRRKPKERRLRAIKVKEADAAPFRKENKPRGTVIRFTPQSAPRSVPAAMKDEDKREPRTIVFIRPK